MPTTEIEQLPELEMLPPFLTLRDVAAILNVDIQTIERMTESGLLMKIKVTERLVRVPKSAVVELLKKLQ